MFAPGNKEKFGMRFPLSWWKTGGVNAMETGYRPSALVLRGCFVVETMATLAVSLAVQSPVSFAPCCQRNLDVRVAWLIPTCD